MIARIVLLFFTFNSLTRADQTISEVCMKESGADLETVKQYENEEKDLDESTDEKVLCYFKCVFDVGGVIQQDGKVSVKVAEEIGLIEGDDKEKEKIKTCLGGLEKVISCTDLLKWNSCFSESRK